jgi:hypothetical protein
MTTMTQNTTRVADAQGNLIGQFRNHANIDAIVKAFAQQSQDLESAAFEVLLDTLIASAVGQQLDNVGDVVGVERGGRTDDDYRVRIGAQILLNNSSGTVEELIGLAVALGVVSFILIELPPATIESYSITPITNGAEIGAVLCGAKAAGVRISFTWFETSSPFTFDNASLGFDQGDLVGMVTT